MSELVLDGRIIRRSSPPPSPQPPPSPPSPPPTNNAPETPSTSSTSQPASTGQLVHYMKNRGLRAMPLDDETRPQVPLGYVDTNTDGSVRIDPQLAAFQRQLQSQGWSFEFKNGKWIAYKNITENGVTYHVQATLNALYRKCPNGGVRKTWRLSVVNAEPITKPSIPENLRPLVAQVGRRRKAGENTLSAAYDVAEEWYRSHVKASGWTQQDLRNVQNMARILAAAYNGDWSYAPAYTQLSKILGDVERQRRDFDVYAQAFYTAEATRFLHRYGDNPEPIFNIPGQVGQSPVDAFLGTFFGHASWGLTYAAGIPGEQGIRSVQAVVGRWGPYAKGPLADLAKAAFAINKALPWGFRDESAENAVLAVLGDNTGKFAVEDAAALARQHPDLMRNIPAEALGLGLGELVGWTITPRLVSAGGEYVAGKIASSDFAQFLRERIEASDVVTRGRLLLRQLKTGLTSKLAGKFGAASGFNVDFRAPEYDFVRSSGREVSLAPDTVVGYRSTTGEPVTARELAQQLFSRGYRNPLLSTLETGEYRVWGNGDTILKRLAYVKARGDRIDAWWIGLVERRGGVDVPSGGDGFKTVFPGDAGNPARPRPPDDFKPSGESGSGRLRGIITADGRVEWVSEPENPEQKALQEAIQKDIQRALEAWKAEQAKPATAQAPKLTQLEKAVQVQAQRLAVPKLVQIPRAVQVQVEEQKQEAIRVPKLGLFRKQLTVQAPALGEKQFFGLRAQRVMQFQRLNLAEKLNLQQKLRQIQVQVPHWKPTPPPYKPPISMKPPAPPSPPPADYFSERRPSWLRRWQVDWFAPAPSRPTRPTHNSRHRKRRRRKRR